VDNQGSLRLEIFVRDIEQSTTFYERVLGFTRRHSSPGYAGVARGSATIGIGRLADLPSDHPLRSGDSERLGLGVEMVLEVDDVEGAFAAAKAVGHPIASPLQDRPWGLRDFRLIDPDGYYIRITDREAPP
jgi:catechol 2,3-dioxygenase-like lactoylglutathione lyase family enzyme